MKISTVSTPVLRTRALTRRFGGLTAVDRVSIDFYRGQVHAIIGPNGAGKSTFADLLSGDLLPTSGSIEYDESPQDYESHNNHLFHDCTRTNRAERARRGIGRSYQKTNIFPSFSVFENCRLAAQAQCAHAWNFFRPAHVWCDINEVADRVLDVVGLMHRRAAMAGTLSHGEQRQLEIALCLAIQPQLLILDEPLAGIAPHEANSLIEIIRKLASDHAIVLIEHDLSAVFTLADHLSVFVNGAVLESGPPDVVRKNTNVQSAYLGDSYA